MRYNTCPRDLAVILPILGTLLLVPFSKSLNVTLLRKSPSRPEMRHLSLFLATVGWPTHLKSNPKSFIFYTISDVFLIQILGKNFTLVQKSLYLKTNKMCKDIGQVDFLRLFQLLAVVLLVPTHSYWKLNTVSPSLCNWDCQIFCPPPLCKIRDKGLDAW